MVIVATYAEMLLQSDHFFESFVDCIPQIVHSITRMSIRPSLMRSQALSQPHRARRSLLDQFKHLTSKFSQTSSFSVFIFLISVTFQNSWAGLSCLLKRWVSHVYTVLMLFRSILGSGAKYLRLVPSYSSCDGRCSNQIFVSFSRFDKITYIICIVLYFFYLRVCFAGCAGLQGEDGARHQVSDHHAAYVPIIADQLFTSLIQTFFLSERWSYWRRNQGSYPWSWTSSSSPPSWTSGS